MRRQPLVCQSGWLVRRCSGPARSLGAERGACGIIRVRHQSMTAQGNGDTPRRLPPRPAEAPPEKAVDPMAATPAGSSSPGLVTSDGTRTGGRAAGASAAAFARGQVVAERYEIVRFIAQGGMGEVYEAEDRKLQGTVALKTIRTDMAGRRERHRALPPRGAHRPAGDPPERLPHLRRGRAPLAARRGLGRTPAPVTFLTMELLGGETLADRLARGRPDRAGGAAARLPDRRGSRGGPRPRRSSTATSRAPT